MIRHGITIRHITGHFSLFDTFDIPAGTPVVHGQTDCTGDPFPHWALTQDTARELSGNAHDAAHRFVTVHPDHVKEKET